MICFYNAENKNGYLSNSYESKFIYDGIEFKTAEQALLYARAKVFNDTDTVNKVISIKDFKNLRREGRVTKNFNSSVWEARQEQVMIDILLAKFSCNPKLVKRLLLTGNDVIANCSIQSGRWGIGLPIYDPRRLQKESWQNENLLGTCLMKVRDILREENKQVEFEREGLVVTLKAFSTIKSQFNKGIKIEICKETGKNFFSIERIFDCETFDDIRKQVRKPENYKVIRMDIVEDVIQVYAVLIAE